MNHNLYAAPTPTKPKKAWKPIAITGVIGLVAGIAVASGNTTAESAPAPTTTATTTVTAAPEPAPTVTVTAEAVATTPQACIDALDDAAELMYISADLTDIFREHVLTDADLIDAILYSDIAGLEAYTATVEGHTDQIVALNDQINQSTFAENATTCRSN